MFGTSYSGIVQRSYPDISVEEADILKNSRRRGVIRALSSEKDMLDSLASLFLDRDNSGPERKVDVIENVASWETGHDVGEVPEDKLNSVHSTLHQCHFPLLDDRGVIDYSKDDMFVESVPETEEYAELVEDRPGKDTALPGVDSSESSFLTIDSGYEILSNERRRHVMNYVENSDKVVDLSSISEHIAGMESDSEGPLSSSKRKAVYVGLHQCHLPKMHEADVLEYSDGRKVIKKGKYFDELVEYLPDDLEPIS